MKPRNVLIIDDDADVITYMSAVLIDHGWLVRSALGADEGLALAREHAPDVILLDLMMPGRGGMSTLAAIRKDPDLSHVLVVLVTGIQSHLNRDFEAYLHRFRHIKPDAYLEKPLTPEQLLATLDELTAAVAR